MQISGKILKEIRKSFTGGSVDVYILTNVEEEKIYCYDVNSLYPSVMSSFDMPIGIPTYFEGDIRKVDPDAFGFFSLRWLRPCKRC